MAHRQFYAEAGSEQQAQKFVILTTVAAILAIVFDGKKKKPSKRKNFIQRTAKNYKFANSSLTAYSAHRKKKQIESEQGIKIHKAEPIDITL